MRVRLVAVLAGLVVAWGTLTTLAQNQLLPYAPRPIDAGDSVWAEELTFMEIRDAIRAGTTTSTGRILPPRPFRASQQRLRRS